MPNIKHHPKIDGSLGWFETAPNQHAEVGHPFVADAHFDVVIIGAGYTGLAVAARLQELRPQQRIAVVDALKVGQGTSGRNAGFIIDLPHNIDSRAQDGAHDLWVHRLNTFAIDRLRAFKDTLGIDCQWDEAGKYMAAHEPAHLPLLQGFMHTLDQAQFGYDYLEGEALAQRLGTAYYQAAVYTPGNILMNPAALVRGIARGLRDRLTVYEDTPITAIDYAEVTRLHTPHGAFTATTVVHTVSAFAEAFGLAKHRLAPVFTYASLTEPLPPDVLAETLGQVPAWGLTSAHPAGSTVRWTPDRRIMVRNSFDFAPQLGHSEAQRQRAVQQHQRSLWARFPALAKRGIGFAHSWGGLLCMTRNHQSVFQKVADKVYVVCGCNGVGVASG
ncbi:MAG: FAD-binding oxidoreductase, partial [Neisseriaceae bacterium]|nr:FAD-binding oxidoreductase [Neisseriaceae bacterium]